MIMKEKRRDIEGEIDSKLKRKGEREEGREREGGREREIRE